MPASGRSKAQLGRASEPLSIRNRCSNKLLGIRRQFRFSFEILLEIALPRTAHCFEVCSERLHKHREVPYANLVCICTKREPVHSMQEARRSRAKVDAENGRTGDSIFRAAISSASNESTSRLWDRAALFKLSGWLELHRRVFCGSGVARGAPIEHFAIQGQTRAAPIEPSAAPEQTRSALFEYSTLLGRLERPFGANCGCGASSSGHFELSQWIRARLERPNAAKSGMS